MDDGLAFRLVDAFTLTPYAGNVAGVILRADGLSDEQMQAIAAEFNASETTFVLPATTDGGDVRFRWFTPGCEVRFCGHATLAGVHAVLEAGRFAEVQARPGTALRVETRTGILSLCVEPQGDAVPSTIWLDMPPVRFSKTPVAPPVMARHLGVSPNAFDPELPAVRTEDDVMLAVRDLGTLLEMQPPMADLKRYCEKERIRGVFVTCRETLSRATVVQSRFFAPAAGVDEDPVTGSAHGPLGVYLVEHGVVELVDGRADFYCGQSKAGGRAGLVRVVVTERDGERQVRIGGSCVTTARGRLARLPAS